MLSSLPTVDITINTFNVQPNESSEGFKPEIVESCKNMMITAEHVINVNPGIQKVVILEHPPRFDAEEVDLLA